jgi:hypothetical protein
MSMPEALPVEPKKNRTGLIIAIVVAVLCCCCLVVVAVGWNFGDQLMELLRSSTL